MVEIGRVRTNQLHFKADEALASFDAGELRKALNVAFSIVERRNELLVCGPVPFGAD